jgi:transposase
MHNTYAIDEKPIIINNFRQKEVRVAFVNKGKMASNKVHTYKFLDGLSNIYLICAITSNCVVLYHLSDTPITTQIFNAFILGLCNRIAHAEKGKFLLIDNASFHGIDESVKEIMKGKNLAFTRTPPMGCLFNPIEEFFACFDKILHRKVNSVINKSTEAITQELFVELIHASVMEASDMDLKQIYRRAGLLEE